MTIVEGCDYCTPAETATSLTPRLTVWTVRHDDDCPILTTLEPA